MPKATLRDILIKGKWLVIRVDFNVPLTKASRELGRHPYSTGSGTSLEFLEGKELPRDCLS